MPIADIFRDPCGAFWGGYIWSCNTEHQLITYFVFPFLLISKLLMRENCDNTRKFSVKNKYERKITGA